MLMRASRRDTAHLALLLGSRSTLRLQGTSPHIGSFMMAFSSENKSVTSTEVTKSKLVARVSPPDRRCFQHVNWATRSIRPPRATGQWQEHPRAVILTYSRSSCRSLFSPRHRSNFRVLRPLSLPLLRL